MAATATARYVALQMAAVAVPRNLFAYILRMIGELQPPQLTSSVVRLAVTFPSNPERDLRLMAKNSLLPLARECTRHALERIHNRQRYCLLQKVANGKKL